MVTQWLTRAAVCGAALIICSCARVQGPQRLRQQISAEPHRLTAGLPAKSLELTSQRPEGLEPPEFRNGTPLFARWLTPLSPRGHLWIALDRTSPDGPYDRLFIDSNGNGRIQDEAAVAPCSTSTTWARFGPVKLTLPGNEAPLERHLNLLFTAVEQSPRLSVSTAEWYEAPIAVGRKTKQCVLLDHNANGVFNDKSLDFAGSDVIQIAESGTQDICLVGNYIRIDDTLYRLAVAPNGADVSLSPARGIPFGTIKVAKDVTELVAGGENGLLTVKPRRGRVKLPAGKYRIYQWVIGRKDPKGDNWTLKGTGFGNPEAFELSAGSEIALAVGEPVISRPEVYKTGGGEYMIAHRFEGPAGEQVQLHCNGVALRPPDTQIRNADGSYERTFKFEFG